MSKDNPKSLKDLGHDAKAIWIDARDIKIRSNVRDFTRARNLESVEEMADNIIAVGGVRLPVSVKFVDGVAELIDGERRVRGSRRAIEKGFEHKIRAIEATGELRSELDVIGAQLLANKNEGLEHIELARAFARMLDLGATYDEISAKSGGYSNQQIANILAMNHVTEDVRDMVDTGALSATLAETTFRKHGAKKGESIVKKAKKIADKTGSTKVTPRHIREAMGESTASEEARDTIKTLTDALIAVTRTSDVAKIHRIARNGLIEVGARGEEDAA
jgi:ParB-like chromosome segregation protein Spo0J